MTPEDLAVMEAIASGATTGLNAPTVEKLRHMGLVCGDQGAAALFLTANALVILNAHRASRHEKNKE